MNQQQCSIEHIEGQDLFLVAAPLSPAGVLLTRPEVSAASLKIYATSGATPTTAVVSVELDVGANPPGATFNECMFLTAQDDGWWEREGSYTFFYRHQDANYHLDGGKSYRVEVTLTVGHPTATFPQLSSYGVLILAWNVSVKPTTGA